MEDLASAHEAPRPAVPLELRLIVDGLPDDIDPELADLKLTYGSPASAPSSLTRVEEQLSQSADAFRQSVITLLNTGQPGVGVPEYARQPVWSKPPEFIEPGHTLNQWLRVARRHQPELANRTVESILETTNTHFDQDAYQETITDLPKTYQYEDIYKVMSTLNFGSRQFAEYLSNCIRDYTTDARIARQFMDSEFFSAFDDDNQRMTLLAHIVGIEGCAGTDGADYSEAYAELQHHLRSACIVEYRAQPTTGTLAAISVIAQNTPEYIFRLAQTSPLRSAVLVWAAGSLLSLEAGAFGVNQGETLTTIASNIAVDKNLYKSYVDMYLASGRQLPAEYVANIVSLLGNYNSSGTDYSLARLATIAAANAPAETLPDLAAKQLHIRVNEEAKAILIRRLARHGQAAVANELISQPTATVDRAARALYRIRNSLAVYEETNDASTLSQAEGLIDTYKTLDRVDPAFTLPIHMHEFAARRYAGAHRHRDQARAAEALQAMGRWQQSPDVDVRRTTLETAIQLFIDLDELDQAECTAQRLLDDAEIMAEDIETGMPAMFAVAKAYMEDGDVHAAIRVASNYLASNPSRARQIPAFTQLFDASDAGTNSHVPPLPHLDPTHQN